MLAKRVIPTMLCRGRTLVKGKAFQGDRSIGHVQQAARVHAKRGVDELLILDIGATAEGRGPDLDMVRELSAECYIPITVGGGVRSCEDIDALLRAGADKIAIGAALHKVPALLHNARERFGAQAIVCVIDAMPDRSVRAPGWGPMDAPFVAKYAADHGAGEIVIQARERDGMLNGYDLDLIREVSVAVSIPVIASGGCGSPEHMHEALQAGADAVAAGAMFAFTDHTPRSCARFLCEKGWEVRQ
jgi:imidazole glycerol-phosphate synthase subunit HisF